MSGLSGLLASSDLDMLGSAVLRTAWPGVALGALALVWLWRTHWGSPIVRSRLMTWALAVAVGSPLAAGAHAQATLAELKAHRVPASPAAWPVTATEAAAAMTPAAPAHAAPAPALAAPSATPPMLVCPRAAAAAREHVAAHAAAAPVARAMASAHAAGIPVTPVPVHVRAVTAAVAEAVNAVSVEAAAEAEAIAQQEASVAAPEAAPARARLSTALREGVREQLDRSDLSRVRMQAIAIADAQLRVAMEAASATLTPAVRLRVQRLAPVPEISEMRVRIE